MKLKGIMAALCLVVTLVMGNSSASAASVSILDHPTLAVLPFANKGIISNEWDREEMNQIHDFAIAELLNTGSFDVVERARLKDVTDEMALAMSGMTNPETAAHWVSFRRENDIWRALATQKALIYLAWNCAHFSPGLKSDILHGKTVRFIAKGTQPPTSTHISCAVAAIFRTHSLVAYLSIISEPSADCK